VTRTPLSRSKVKVTRPLWLVVLAGQHGHTVMVTYPYEYMMYIVSPLAGLGGGISWWAAHLQLVLQLYYIILQLTHAALLLKDLYIRRRRRRFRIDTEVRCVGAHPPYWPLEPARVKPN